ncbi:uncharacterized protein PRCAT00000083001 [Priceomyces carsonii]|uniref:uncharacterized protein n=1 Tax=Priceomyces carsonii TaxID=28549 RepID=UPI002ED9F597|nr:unnamed protein product [Priceomyces carsonii]
MAILDRLRTTKAPKETVIHPIKNSKNYPAIARLRNKEVSVTGNIQEDEAKSNIELESSEPTLNMDLAFSNSLLLSAPQSSISLILFQRNQNDRVVDAHSLDSRKRRKKNPDFFHVITNIDINIETLKNAEKNFKHPSPDDLVHEAQNKAFESDMKDLKIADSVAPEKIDRVAPRRTKPFKKINIAEELASNKLYSKPHISFVVMGHVDAGKSTLLGRILFDLKVVDAKTVNKLVRESEKSGKGSFALAWIMDQTSDERTRGVTVDICATTFETNKVKFTAIDAPGHRDFVPQTIGGVSQADLALLVVDSINGEFEAGFNMDGQTKEHTILARSLGLSRICVAVNKMDKENWSEKRYNEIKSHLTEFLTSEEIGYQLSQIEFIPISGLSGVNVISNSKLNKEFNWYHGPTLIEYLENLELPLKEFNDRRVQEIIKEEFILMIIDVIEISNSEFEVAGKILSGHIQPGETVVIHPFLQYLQIQAIKIEDSAVEVAIIDDRVSLRFKKDLLSIGLHEVKAGDIVTCLESSIKVCHKFICSLYLFNMPKPLLVGTPFILFRGSSYQPARISRIIEVKGSNKKKRMHLSSNQFAVVEIELQGQRPLVLANYLENKILGRIVIRREGVTVGAGKVTELDSI